MSITETITDAAGRVRDASTNMFVAKGEAAVNKAKQHTAGIEARIATNEGNLVAEDDQYTSLTQRVAAGEAIDNVTDLLTGINQRRQFYRDLRAPLERELQKARQALADAEDADAAKKRKEFNKSQLKSFDQHIAQIKHTLTPIPQALEMLHKAVTEARDAGDKALALSGHPPVNIAELLGRAIKAAGLEDILADALRATQGGQTRMDGVTGHFEGRKFIPDHDTEIRHMSEEVGAALKQSRSDFELELGLRELNPEEVAEQREAEREAERQKEADRRKMLDIQHRIHRLQTDPNFYAAQFPGPGSAPPPLPGDTSRQVQRDAEQRLAGEMARARAGAAPTPQFSDQEGFVHPSNPEVPEASTTGALEATVVAARAERAKWNNPE